METKAKIISLIKEQITKSIEALESVSDDFKDSADLDEEATRDLDDFSQQSEDADMQQRLQNNVNQAQQSLQWIEENSMIKNDTVSRGALVETKTKWFYFGIALPTQTIEAESKPVIGISEVAPIYPYLEGKKKGDTMEIGEEKLEILEVY